MSLGLASLLDERDLAQPPEGHAQRSRAFSGSSTADPMHLNSHSNPSRFPSLVSETHYRPMNVSSPSTTSSTTHMTNNYRLISSPSTFGHTSVVGQRSGSQSVEKGQGDSEKKPDLSQVSDFSRSNVTSMSQSHATLSGQTNVGSHTTSWVSALANLSPGAGALGTTLNLTGSVSNNDSQSALGVINKLKNTGFSIYGYITGVGGQSDGDRSSSVDSNGKAKSSNANTYTNTGLTNTDHLRPNSLRLISGANSSQTAFSVMSSTVSLSSSASMATGVTGGVNATTTAESSSSQGRKLTKMLTGSSATGVLGALAKLHRDSSL